MTKLEFRIKTSRLKKGDSLNLKRIDKNGEMDSKSPVVLSPNFFPFFLSFSFYHVLLII